jgi:O-antigen ligase
MRAAALSDRPAEPVPLHLATRGRGAVRWSILTALGLAPLAVGSRYPAAYVPLLLVAFAGGAYSLYREYRLRRSGRAVAPVPGVRPLLGLLAIVAIQMVPLPPRLLAIVSPGSFAFYNDALLLPLRTWKPITASPSDTARGFTFLAGMTALYLSTFREFDHPLWRRRLLGTIVLAGSLMTIEALIQQAYSARVIYGVYRPTWDWAVFGPYVNRDLFAGYVLMAAPLAVGFSAEAALAFGRAWDRRRRRPWLALGDAEGMALFRRATAALVLLSGLVAARSAGALIGLVAGVLGVGFMAKDRRVTLALVLTLAAVGAAWAGFGAPADFVSLGLEGRVAIWRDSLRLVPLHPLLGIGLNAFGTAFPPRQHVWRGDWVGATHNEYLEILVDVGLAGLILSALLLGTLVRRSFLASRQGMIQAGVFAAIVGVLAHNVIDYNWQLAANAATFVALSAIAVQSATPAVLTARKGMPRIRSPREWRLLGPWLISRV